MVNWFLWVFFFHQNSYLVMLSKFSFSVPVFSQAYVLLLWCQWRHNLQLLRIRKWEILKMNITVQHCNNFFFFETLRFLIECSNFVIQDGWWHFSYHLCTDIHTKWIPVYTPSCTQYLVEKKPKQIKKPE